MSDDPVAIVTAASRGIGAACARELSARGYRLALLSRSDEIHQFAGELDAIAVAGSVSLEADLERLVIAAVEQYGRIDAVVNNTGHAPRGELLDLSDQDWSQGFDLLFLNVVRMTRLITPVMLRQRIGSIVNISTFGAAEPSPDFPVSSTIRTTLGAFAKLFSIRYAANGLRMNNVLPGHINTFPVGAEDVGAVPSGPSGRAEDVARVVAFLASEHASYVTGQSLLVDGGLVRGL